MKTIVRVGSIVAGAMAVLVLVTGYDIFYGEPVSGSARLRAVVLWALGALALWWLAGKL